MCDASSHNWEVSYPRGGPLVLAINTNTRHTFENMALFSSWNTFSSRIHLAGIVFGSRFLCPVPIVGSSSWIVSMAVPVATGAILGSVSKYKEQSRTARMVDAL